MALHRETFGYLKPTNAQTADMNIMRVAAREYADRLESILPDGADKTYILRRVRETAMWVNVCLTREADGTPR